jgi:diguanylate cyclase (GGDEF)-like protein
MRCGEIALCGRDALLGTTLILDTNGLASAGRTFLDRQSSKARLVGTSAATLPPMHIDIASLLLAMTVSMVTMAVALPLVMGQVNVPARRAQIAVVLQASGWALLLVSGMVEGGSWADQVLSTLSMAGIAGGLALNATAFDLWCGRAAHDRAPALIALMLPLGYYLGFSSYAFRVGWANGLLTLQMALVAASLWRQPAVPVGKWRWLLVLSLLAQMLVTAWRGVLGAFFTESYPTFLAPHPVNLAFAVIGNATTVLSLVAILLAHRDEAARELERLATVDGLTGVFNRRAWLARAKTEMAVSTRYGHPVAVLMMDLDHFKEINDTRGHEAGDNALQFVAKALQAAVRAGDIVGRYGGEEFCVLMNHADQAAAIAFDCRMRTCLAEEAPAELGFALSYSAGIAMRASPHDTLEAMLRRADSTLYRAKAQGRARTLDAQGLQLRLA